MPFLATAAEARERSQGNDVIAEEVFVITLRVIAAQAANQLSTVASATTQVSVNGTTITGSTMTNADATGRSYYQVWRGTATDATKTEQMNEVISYFKNLGYSVVRKSTTGTEFYWDISW